MGFRSARAVLVLAGLTGILAAAVNGGTLARVAGAALAVAAAAGIIWLDGLRRSGRMPR